MSMLSSSAEDMLSVESDSSTSSEGTKIDIMFEHCHWYDIPCPYPECHTKNIRFNNHNAFKAHHEQCHCPRSHNGDINRAKDSLRWQCPVLITTIIEGKEITEQCNKVSNSWYNYAGHITSHKEIGHGWGCALKPAGKRKKTNIKRLVRDNRGNMIKMTVCGKKTSTKHHLLAHMANVHKTHNVIDTNGRQYNKKKKSSRSNRTKSKSVIGKKRKFREIDDKDVLFMKVNNYKKMNNASSTSLLQMPLPTFQPLQSIPMHTMPQFPNLFTSKHNQLPLVMNHLVPLQSIYPHLALNASSHHDHGKQCVYQREQFNFLKLLCKAAHTHRGCIKCSVCHDMEDEIEASLPSLSHSSNVSPSGSMSDDTSTTTNNLSVPKLPQLPSTIFPNFETPPQTITKNVPFTFDLNQLQCAANTAHNATAFLEKNVITTAIPSLPIFTQKM